MSSEPFGVRSAKRDGSLKKRAISETLSSLNYVVRTAGTFHGIFRRKRIYQHVRLTMITCRKNTIRNRRSSRHPNARTSPATEMSHLARLR